MAVIYIQVHLLRVSWYISITSLSVYLPSQNLGTVDIRDSVAYSTDMFGYIMLAMVFVLNVYHNVLAFLFNSGFSLEYAIHTIKNEN